MISWESADHTIKKKVLKSGNFSTKPTERAVCQVIIEHILVTNIILDQLTTDYHSEIINETWNEKEWTIGEANSEIDRKIERAVQMMMIGEKSLVELSVSSFTSPNILISFEITLKHFDPFQPIWEWSPETKYDLSLKYKEQGIKLFEQSRHVDAFHKFSKACKILITLEPIKDLELEKKLECKINELRLVLYNNMAGCQLNRKNYELAIALCNKILSKDQTNVKALYRRGIAYGQIRDFDHAVIDLKKAIDLEPYNSTVKQQYLLYSAKFKEANKKCDDMTKRMLTSYLKTNL